VDAARLPARHRTRPDGRVERWSAVALAVVTVLLLAGAVPLARSAGLSSGVGAGFVLVLIAFLAVGSVLAQTRPRNPIGWSMLGVAFFGCLTTFAGPYVVDH
jgi:hypothetical protein